MIRKLKDEAVAIMVPDETEIDELRSLIGAHLVIELLKKLGGKSLYVPKAIGPHHPLTNAIGLEAATLVCERFGGDTLRLPTSERKRQAILVDIAKGMGTLEIATKYWCSGRYVRYLKAGVELDPVPEKQMKLL